MNLQLMGTPGAVNLTPVGTFKPTNAFTGGHCREGVGKGVVTAGLIRFDNAGPIGPVGSVGKSLPNLSYLLPSNGLLLTDATHL